MSPYNVGRNVTTGKMSAHKTNKTTGEKYWNPLYSEQEVTYSMVRRRSQDARATAGREIEWKSTGTERSNKYPTTALLDNNK